MESEQFPEFKCQVDEHTVAYVRNPGRHSEIPILMVHGAIVSHLCFLPTADLLAKDYDVIIPDMVGHGHSSMPAHSLPVQTQAQILRRFLQVMEIPKVYLVANSYGCEIATEFAINFPEMIERLVLIGPASDPHEKNIGLQFLRLMHDGLVERPKMHAVLFRDIMCMSLRRAIETSKIMIRHDYRPRLPLITSKPLVVRGKNDPLAPQRWAEEATSLIPGARLVIVDGAPHNVQFSKPKEMAELVKNEIESKNPADEHFQLEPPGTLSHSQASH